MALQKIGISGYRGFNEHRVMEFAVPNGSDGSGLTIITGANNSGKSTILESIRARTGHQLSFTAGARNAIKDYVSIDYHIDGEVERIRSLSPGPSEVVKENAREQKMFVLPSRRAFDPYFGKSTRERDDYTRAYGLPPQRSNVIQEFSSRLFKILKNPNSFNDLTEEALGFRPVWTIDQTDQGNFFLKFYNAGASHSSDGMGEGIVSIFAIMDALHDSIEGELIAIDEPELSLHPSLQKRVSKILSRYAKDRQIVVSTHSPYFVNIEALSRGAHLSRIARGGEGTDIFELTKEAKAAIEKLSTGNLYNPHVLGLNAREIFFQEDGIVLTEGQEDVVLYPKVIKKIGIDIQANFFGWGVGGADNMIHFSEIFSSLGFQKVVGLLDGDRRHQLSRLTEKFPNFYFAAIPAADIRTKPPRPATEAVEGLLNENLELRPGFEREVADLFADVSDYLAGKVGRPGLTPATS